MVHAPLFISPFLLHPILLIPSHFHPVPFIINKSAFSFFCSLILRSTREELMSQHSTHSFADKDSRPSSSLSYYSTYSSDKSQSQSHSPDPEADAEHPPHQAQSPSNVDATSFLGSVWNLVKDAKELAAKELDRLLDNFPYKHQANNTQEVCPSLSRWHSSIPNSASLPLTPILLQTFYLTSGHQARPTPRQEA